MKNKGTIDVWERNGHGELMLPGILDICLHETGRCDSGPEGKEHFDGGTAFEAGGHSGPQLVVAPPCSCNELQFTPNMHFLSFPWDDLALFLFAERTTIGAARLIARKRRGRVMIVEKLRCQPIAESLPDYFVNNHYATRNGAIQTF